MGTSLTPGFWRLFAVLLVISTAITFVVSALLDVLAVGLRQRGQRRRLSADHADGTTDRGDSSGRPDPAPARC